MKNFVFALIVGLLPLTTFAGVICDSNDWDIFSNPATMPPGNHFGPGECIDTSKNRSVHRVTDEEKQNLFYYVKDPSLRKDLKDPSMEVVANFVDVETRTVLNNIKIEDRFWVAIIPKERIQFIGFEMMPIASYAPLFHGQLRFHLTPKGRPVRLIKQVFYRGEEPQAKILNDDIVFAEFGVRAQRHEESFNMVHGMLNYYVISYAMGSYMSLTESDRAAGDLIREYKLNMTVAQAVDTLQAGITIGTEREFKDIYNTLSESCLNAVIMALNDGLGNQRDDFIGRSWQSINPTGKLQRLGLIDAKNPECSRIDDTSPQVDPKTCSAQ